MKRIAFGCDHVGIILKDDILAHLRQRGIDVVDKGAWSTERTDSIAANKHPGIRAVVCSEPYSAQLSRQHNNTNILAFGARVIGLELAKMIVDAWLAAEFEGGRHQGRVDAIGAIEQLRI